MKNFRTLKCQDYLTGKIILFFFSNIQNDTGPFPKNTYTYKCRHNVKLLCENIVNIFGLQLKTMLTQDPSTLKISSLYKSL